VRVDDADLTHGGQPVVGEHGRQGALGIVSGGEGVEGTGPCAGSAIDCVATAPTPGRAHGHIEPTQNQCDCTATPSSPDAGSKATIE
jgi:hypothetical protein